MKADSVFLVVVGLFICNAGCQHNDSGSINFLSFFPCTNISDIRSPGECDIFLYPAALLAQEHINNHQLDIFTGQDRTYKLRVIETQTKVGLCNAGQLVLATLFNFAAQAGE